MTTTQSRAGRPLLGELESFDELSKGVAAGTISRRKALALAGGAALSAALVPFAAPAEAGRRRRRRCRDKEPLCRSGSKESLCDRPVTEERACFCMKREPDGRKVCINIVDEICQKTDQCNNSNDCPGSQVCVSLRGGACCGGGAQGTGNLCVRNCPRNNKRARGKGGQTALLR